MRHQLQPLVLPHPSQTYRHSEKTGAWLRSLKLVEPQVHILIWRVPPVCGSKLKLNGLSGWMSPDQWT